MNLPDPPTSTASISRRSAFLVAAGALFVGGVIGYLLAPGDDGAERAAVASAEPSTESTNPSPTEESTLPPAEGATDTGATGPTSVDSIEEPDSELGSSIDNPVPIRDSGTIGEWTVEIAGLTRNADDAIQAENQFNEKPGPGNQFVMVTLNVTYNGKGSSDPYFDLTWAVVSEEGTLFEEASLVLPKDLIGVGNVPSGISGLGNVAFEVDRQAAASLVLYIEADTASFETEGAFFALD